MEEIPIYNAYDICRDQSCQCRSCGNDRSGICLAGTGDCTEAMGQGRCPVMECATWMPKAATKAAEIITTEYTIADKARELQEAFREQYGVEVDIRVRIFDGPDNPQLNRETAERLGRDMAKDFGVPSDMGQHGEGDAGVNWFDVNLPHKERIAIVLFYGEEAPHEQSD